MNSDPHPNRRFPDKEMTVIPEWIYLRALVCCLCTRFDDERGEVVEKVLLVAIFAGLAIGVGALIVDRVTARANEIPLR
jgi:hypothetical protein